MAANFGIDLVTALRVGTMLVFIAVFAGIAVWLLTPRGRGRAREQGLSILQDDDSGPAARPARMEDRR